MTAKFKLKDGIQPGFKKKMPFTFLPQINEELERLERTGVLSKIQYNQWASSTVYVKKKSKEIRVCVNLSTGFNAALKDYHYLLPSPEEIFPKLNGGNFFSKIDLKDAYVFSNTGEGNVLSCSVSILIVGCTFPDVFEVKVALAIFQQVMDTTLIDFADRLRIFWTVKMNSQNVEHKKHVHKVFSRIQEYDFKLKESKCNFFMEKIKYLGHIIDKDGRRPNPEEATTIKDMPAPENVSALQSFLGLANYYQVFIPNVA